MRCPVCLNNLQGVKTPSAVVDVCPECKGIWFESEEMAGFVNALAASEKIKPSETKFFVKRDSKSIYDLKEKQRVCPKCKISLKKLNYAGDSNVFIDKCPNCGGVWADAGEVKAIAEYVKEDPRATAVARGVIETLNVPEPDKEAQAFSFFYFPRIVVPYADDVERERFPVVTIGIITFLVIFLTIKIFIDPQKLLEGIDFLDDRDRFLSFDYVNSASIGGSLLGLVWNMLFLWLFGDNVEDRFSRLGYLLFFILCGVFSGVLYLLLSSKIAISFVVVSGAVSGVIGAYFIFYPTASIRIFIFSGTVEVLSVICLGLWFLFQFVYPAMIGAASLTDTTCLANIGGFMLGAAVGYVKKQAEVTQ